MAACKDCVHFGICGMAETTIAFETKLKDLVADDAEMFNCFKDKSNFIEVPCKINDVVYGLVKYNGGMKVKKGIVNEMFFTKDMELVIVMYHLIRGKWGEVIFPTEEAAEAALKALKGGAGNG